MRRSGGCLCGAVRYTLTGQPLRAGICHCLDCRKASGSHFTPFGVWPASAFECSGAMKVFAERSFCPLCGARIAWFRDNEAEIMLGSLDGAPTGIVPEYELWTGRREEWMLPLPWTEQFDHDRPESAPAE
ncbi:aldehyde-activating protein [Mesorhizobium hungaricum]|uniref:Aldehyde-activating protein n=1 Tax=Mesorhizobium hungaricum TaxID=1566387 RepID=A0A1C2E7D8_9HYPH|nr:aldehyde-activating protein [Mesorhizobium hungaricum]